MSESLVAAAAVAAPPVVAVAAPFIDPTTVAAIAAVLTVLINGVLAYMMARLNKKSDVVESKVAAVDSKVDAVVTKVEEVHKATNGLTEKLKDAALAAGRAEGHAAGMQDQRTNTAVRENGRAEGVRDEKLRRAEMMPASADPVPVKVVAAVPVPVKETPG